VPTDPADPSLLYAAWLLLTLALLHPPFQEELDKMKSSLGNAILEEKPNVK